MTCGVGITHTREQCLPLNSRIHAIIETLEAGLFIKVEK